MIKAHDGNHGCKREMRQEIRSSPQKALAFKTPSKVVLQSCSITIA